MNAVKVGDWGRDGTQNQSAVAALMATVADAVRPDFILSVGDNFYESKPFLTMTAASCAPALCFALTHRAPARLLSDSYYSH